MGEMTIIPASPKWEAGTEEKPTLRVAAYIRVSTLHSEQEESFESQKQHFEETINNNPLWVNAGLYSDQGITGLSTKKRRGFQKMMRDARKGAMDVLLVKSISRFARNTLDSVAALRELKTYGVDVRFEKEGIRTGDANGELLLTMLSAFAQSESESISANTTLGFRYKHARGEYSLAYGTFLGYDKGPNGKLVINPEQAETVREIYGEFLDGTGLDQIARKLKEEGRLTGSGRTAWTKTGLRRIILNEKMCGDALLQKSVTEDLMTKRKIANNGLAPMYYIKDDHEAIVDRQTYLIAKGELARRERQFIGVEVDGPDIYTGKYEFTRKICCPRCGAWYNHANARSKAVWKCYNRATSSTCKSEIIPEDELKQATLTAMQMLYDMQPEIKMKNVPVLDVEDDEDKLVNAAAAFSYNTFAQRTVDFLNGYRPELYDAQLTRRLLERIDFDFDTYTICFYGDVSIKVPKTSTYFGNGRRLQRSDRRTKV